MTDRTSKDESLLGNDILACLDAHASEHPLLAQAAKAIRDEREVRNRVARCVPDETGARTPLRIDAVMENCRTQIRYGLPNGVGQDDLVALLNEIDCLRERVNELHALGQQAANRADDAERRAPETTGELAEDIDGRDCEIAFNAIQHYLGSETAHLKPAEQYAVFKRVARSLERDCDEMVRGARP